MSLLPESSALFDGAGRCVTRRPQSTRRYLREIRRPTLRWRGLTIKRERHVRHTDCVLTFDGSPSLPLRLAELPGDALSAGPAGPIGRAIQLGSRVDGLPASTGDEPGPDDVADGACPWTPTVPLAPYWNR